ncbi:MAG: transcription repressor NadR [Oscillospiraceae bacterium]|nr:transcription repressor NadR [Oscillospiraceae bacterium]
MNAEQRRHRIMELLRQAEAPLSGSALAKLLGVSRQIVVQDMALLRAQTGEAIISTYQGYVLLKEKSRCSRVFKVRHSAERTQEELQEIVDLSGKVEDVLIYHRVYGIVRGQLNIASRKDVLEFMQRLGEGSSAPLMQITDDFHYHTVTADTEQTLDQIELRLKTLGFLAPLREHEPDGVSGL